MHPKVLEMLALQKVDTAIEAETREIESIPAALAALDARIRELEEGLERRREGLKEAQKKRRGLEGEVELIRQKLARYQGQLMEVKTNEAYRLMLKEIDTVKAEIASREERILEEMLRADELEAAIRKSEKEFHGSRSSLQGEKADLERRGAVAEERRRALEAERTQVAGRLGGEFLASYQRVYRSRGGMAVAEAREELCLGCRVKLRPQICQDVRVGVELRTCESCGRFLYTLESPREDASPGESPEGTAPARAVPSEGEAARPDEPTA